VLLTIGLSTFLNVYDFYFRKSPCSATGLRKEGFEPKEWRCTYLLTVVDKSASTC
jgi:hypothetical protein